MTSVSAFNLDQLARELDAIWSQYRELQHSVFQPAMLKLQVHPKLQSTNQTLSDLLEQGAGQGTVVIAGEQQAGRGQWGRQWQSSPGGLYLSFALSLDLAVDSAAQLTQAIAWGIATALQAVHVPVQLKWPNDLILAGRKLGGILTETRLQRGRIYQAIVGVGLNWKNQVPETGINLDSYRQSHAEVSIDSLEALTALTLAGISLGATALQSKPVEVRVKDYQQLLANLGQQLVIDNQLGTIVGVSPTGELLVKIPAVSAMPMSGVEDSTTLIALKPGTISLGYGSTG